MAKTIKKKDASEQEIRRALSGEGVDDIDTLVKNTLKAVREAPVGGEDSLWIAFRSDKWALAGPG